MTTAILERQLNMPPATPTIIPAVNVMLDIETYGTAPGSVIKTIGAVKFGFVPETGGNFITDRFYRRIDAASAVNGGLVMDAETVEWWLQQSAEARSEMVLRGEELGDVLRGFACWLGFGAEVWGNGVGFDNSLVRAAYAAAKIDCPWKHTADRCYRTIKNANRDLTIDAYRVRTHHNALDDAESQALHLMAIWERDAETKRLAQLARDNIDLINAQPEFED